MTYLIVKWLLVLLVLPPGGPLVLLLVGMALAGRRPRLGRGIAAAGAVSLWLLSTPIVVGLLIAMFGHAKPLDIDDARHAQAIVVLGGGVRRNAVEYGGETVGELTLERVRLAAALFRRTGLPILVAGGTPPTAVHSEADLMREALQSEYGIAPRWVEDTSANTRENAINSAALLLPRGVKRIVLVTHAFDAPRGCRQFELAGFKVLSAPTQIPVIRRWNWRDFFPSAEAMQDSFYLGYEALAAVADRVLPDR